MKLVYLYIVIFFNFSTTSNHLHPLQVENCDSNSRLVVDENDNGKFRLERVRPPLCTYRLNWAGRTFWGWWDEWDDTVLQTQNSKFEPCDLRRSSLPLGHGGSSQYWIFTSEQVRNIMFLWNLNSRAGFEPAISDFLSRQL